MMQFIAHVLQMFQHRLDDCTFYDGNGWSVSAANNLKSNQNFFKYISSEPLRVLLTLMYPHKVQVLDDNVPVGVGEDAELHACGCEHCQVENDSFIDVSFNFSFVYLSRTIQGHRCRAMA